MSSAAGAPNYSVSLSDRNFLDTDNESAAA
jgi:hypothetical protein